jgi:hypothetical protein
MYNERRSSVPIKAKEIDLPPPKEEGQNENSVFDLLNTHLNLQHDGVA